MSYSNLREAVFGQRLPCVVVDMDAFEFNIRAMKKLVQGTDLKIRVATKSIRVPDLIRKALESGLPVEGLMTYSCEETKVLSDLGFDDFLVAYPTVQSSDLKLVREIHEAGKKVRLVCDSFIHIRALADAMKGVSKPFEVCMEIDASLHMSGAHVGVRRSPIRTTDELIALIKNTESIPEVRVTSLMVYEAQVAGLGDMNPFKKVMNPGAKVVRTLSVKKVSTMRKKISEEIEKAGISIEVFNGGGTGSVSYCANEPWLTEVTVGSGFLCSHLFSYYSNLKLKPAFYFAAQACRTSDPGFVTCQGGGYIASGEPGWDKVPVVAFPQGASLVSMEGCGEVQTPVQTDVDLNVGDPVFFRHAKAGELAERFNEYLLIQGKDIRSRAKTYRGLGHAFF